MRAAEKLREVRQRVGACVLPTLGVGLCSTEPRLTTPRACMVG